MKPILDIRDLSIEFRAGPRKVEPIVAVRRATFSIRRGEIFALVGSAGSGKTATALALGGMLPPRGRVFSGEAILSLGAAGDEDESSESVNLFELPARKFRKLRRSPLAYLFRDIENQLNPKLTIRQHIRESVRLAGRETVLKNDSSWMPVLYEVGLVEPEAVLDRFPDELEEVVVQRLLIAMALMRGVEILIADEPTSQLDATAENQILRLLNKLRANRGLSILLLTHNFGILRSLADRVAVMFEGLIVETGTAEEILNHPEHPYTRALLDCVPKLGERRHRLGRVDHVAIRDQLGL